MRRLMLVMLLIIVFLVIVGFTNVMAPLYYKTYPVVNIKVNGAEIVSNDVPAFQIDGRTMVPIRLVAEALKAEVNWDEATRTVLITKQEPVKQEEPVKEEELSEKSIRISNISSNTNQTAIKGEVYNRNEKSVAVKFTINFYNHGEYVGHVHVNLDNLGAKETREFLVDAEDGIFPNNRYEITIDSLKAK